MRVCIYHIYHGFLMLGPEGPLKCINFNGNVLERHRDCCYINPPFAPYEHMSVCQQFEILWFIFLPEPLKNMSVLHAARAPRRGAVFTTSCVRRPSDPDRESSPIFIVLAFETNAAQINFRRSLIRTISQKSKKV